MKAMRQEVRIEGADAPPDLLRGLLGHLVDPLFRHAYTLIINTGLTSGLGLLYWILAGRLYSPEQVGQNAAVISSIVFLAGLAQLNLRPVLGRFVPVAGRATAHYVLLAYGCSAIVALVVATIYLLTSDIWAAGPPIPLIRGDAVAALLFVVGTAIWTIFALQDGVLIGFRATLSLTVENVTFGIAKIAIVVGLAALATPPDFAITISWIAPMLVAIVGINLLIFGKLIPERVRSTHTTEQVIHVRRIARFAAGDYVGSLFALSYVALLPVIIINQVGSVAAAQFYVVWVIAASLQLLPANMVLSLVVDTAADPTTFARQGRRMLIGMARVVVPISLITVIAAPFILRLFGPTYEQATNLLRLLGLSIIPYGINLLYLGRSRIRVNAPRIIAVQAAIACLILGLSLALLPVMGVDGVGVAFLIGQGAVAAVLLATVLRPLLVARPTPS